MWIWHFTLHRRPNEPYSATPRRYTSKTHDQRLGWRLGLLGVRHIGSDVGGDFAGADDDTFWRKILTKARSHVRRTPYELLEVRHRPRRQVVQNQQCALP
jgi:hypothetical protein